MRKHQEKLIKDAEKQAAAQKAGEAERKKDEGPKKDMDLSWFPSAKD